MNEAELLFTEIFNCDKVSLCLDKDMPLDRGKSTLISSVLQKRIKGEPIQYILGKTEFMGLEFKVTPAVFIPRPETEILVETALKQLSAISYRLSDINVLDVGTGSGCIAVSLAKFIPSLKIDAVDISKEALIIAKRNAILNNVKVNFIQADLFKAYSLKLKAYNLIISNPPYIPTHEIDNLQPEIAYEPQIALDGDKDGLGFYRRIISRSPRYLKEKGFLILEIGFGQARAVENIFKNARNFEIIEVIKDYNNIDRVIVAKNINPNPKTLNSATKIGGLANHCGEPKQIPACPVCRQAGSQKEPRVLTREGLHLEFRISDLEFRLSINSSEARWIS